MRPDLGERVGQREPGAHRGGEVVDDVGPQRAQLGAPTLGPPSQQRDRQPGPSGAGGDTEHDRVREPGAQHRRDQRAARADRQELRRTPSG